MENTEFMTWLTRIENKGDALSERITKLESNEKVSRLLFGATGIIIGFVVREVLTKVI